jgi:hypothetical protein
VACPKSYSRPGRALRAALAPDPRPLEHGLGGERYFTISGGKGGKGALRPASRPPPPLQTNPVGLRKNTILYFGGFGGEKVQKVQRSTKSSSMLFWPYFNSNNPPQMVNNTMQHISNAITTSPGVKQSFVISIGTFHEASAIISVLRD